MDNLDPPSPPFSIAAARQRFGLYIHVPFCLAKCPYCDFLSWRREDLATGVAERLTQALTREIDLALDAHATLGGRPLHSIYFGGGTPSLLDPQVVGDLIARAGKAFVPQPDIEITLECNPLTAETQRLEEFQDAGVNRISLGVQSFDATTLRALGRAHGADEARAACSAVTDLKFNSWGLDLIFGAPRDGTSPPDADINRLRADLEETMRLAPPHVSVYGLTLHEGTELHRRHAEGRLLLPDEEAQREMFLLTRRTLRSAGWRHYEISNYARPGHESRHNALYWTGGEYLGIGVGAHSCFGEQRRANPRTPTEYLESIEQSRHPATPEEPPSRRSLRGERIMLALRRCDGVDPAELSEWVGCDFQEEYTAEIEKLTKEGLLSVTIDNVRLTEEGILLSDSVFEEWF
jgi:putative oxygen-independent coproporphyrinogen III oxidase